MKDRESCYFCGCGITAEADRLTILGQPMCFSCEKQLVGMSVKDDCYKKFKDKIKTLWFTESVPWH